MLPRLRVRHGCARVLAGAARAGALLPVLARLRITSPNVEPRCAQVRVPGARRVEAACFGFATPLGLVGKYRVRTLGHAQRELGMS
jgi:hypothetical protein